MIRYQTFVVTTDADGAGTVTDGPVNGEIIEVSSAGTAWASTADYTIVRAGDFGGTILAVTDCQEPWSYQPRASLVTTGTAAITNSYGRIPSDGYLTLTLAEAGSVVAGTVTVFYDDLA